LPSHVAAWMPARPVRLRWCPGVGRSVIGWRGAATHVGAFELGRRLISGIHWIGHAEQVKEQVKEQVNLLAVAELLVSIVRK
jgi:hypothetical protein